MRRVFAILALLGAVQAATVDRGWGAQTAAGGRGFMEGQAENALEERLFADAADGRLDEYSPLRAALVAGGVDRVDLLRLYERKAKDLVEELRRSGKVSGRPRQKAEAIFEFLHQRVLRGGYDLAYTDLRRVIDEGHYNCVSATVLFNYLAGEFGLDCRGLEMPGHAMSRLVFSDGSLDVETTCPSWFRYGGPKGQASIARKAIGSCCKGDSPIYAAQKSGQSPREVTPIQLAAMIYYNRGVDLLSEKRFFEAGSANAKALRLDPGNATARGNLLATINNWSIELGNARRYAEAAELLRQGLAMDAKFEAFARNHAYVHRQWAEQLSREGRFEEAKRVKSLGDLAAPRPCVQISPAVD
jgi:tetratricopeptide (TPR) repeat protein